MPGFDAFLCDSKLNRFGVCSVHRTKQVGGELGFITPREFLMTAELHSLITSQYITGQERHKDPLRLVYGYTSINNDGE